MSLVRPISRHFIISEAVVSGFVFLISLSDSSLLAYKNATNFWINFVFGYFTEFIYQF